MTEPMLLSEAQMRRIERYVPLSRGRARVNDRRMLSGIVYLVRNGRARRDATPAAYGAHETL